MKYKDIILILENLNINNYTINKDLTVDVHDSVDISNKSLKKIPVKFGYVDGNFNCENNELSTLEGAPISVNGDFYCGYNKLTNLDYLPKNITSLHCCKNSISTLENIKLNSVIKGSINISHNKIKNLKNMPIIIKGDFNCSFNRLSNLIGCPKIVYNDFSCDGNKIESLQYSIKKIGGNASFSMNKISDLKYLPKINKSLYLDHNLITDISLIKFGESVENISIGYNKITSLKGMPMKINGSYCINNNLLTSLEHSPTKINGFMNCSNNKLDNLKFLPNNIINEFLCFNNCLVDLDNLNFKENKIICLKIEENLINQEYLLNFKLDEKNIRYFSHDFNIDGNVEKHKMDTIIYQNIKKENTLLKTLVSNKIPKNNKKI